MTDDERPPRTGPVAPEGVQLRRHPATVRPVSVWLGGILAFGLLLGGGSLVLRGGPAASDPGDRADPSASATTAEVASPGPTKYATLADGRRFEASLEQTDSCLHPAEGGDGPTAQVNFKVTWDGDVPLALIENGIDGDAWSWYGSGGMNNHIATSGTFDHFETGYVGEPYVAFVRFYEDTGEAVPGPVVLEVTTPFQANPTNLCNPPSSGPPPTDQPPLLPARDGVLATSEPDFDVEPGSSCADGPCTFMAKIEVVSQCLDDEDTAIVTFRISWDGSVPIDRVQGDIGRDSRAYREENELGADGRLGSSAAYERVVNVRVGRSLWVSLVFWEEIYPTEPDELHHGLALTYLAGPALFDPQNCC